MPMTISHGLENLRYSRKQLIRFFLLLRTLTRWPLAGIQACPHATGSVLVQEWPGQTLRRGPADSALVIQGSMRTLFPPWSSSYGDHLSGGWVIGIGSPVPQPWLWSI
jgi:hypothetical protein